MGVKVGSEAISPELEPQEEHLSLSHRTSSASRRMLSSSVLLVIGMLGGCDDGESTRNEASAHPMASDVPAAPRLSRPIGAMPAFDLVATPDRAMLVWADETAVRVLRITPEGRVERERKLADAAKTLEVTAAVGNGLGVAWMAGAESTELIATVVDVDRLEGAEPAVLTEVTTTRSEKRGRMAMASAPDGRLTLFARGPQEPCEDGGEELCATFATHDLPADGSENHRPGLTVPHPCAVPIAGFAIGNGHWHYAVCNISKGRNTTVLFTARARPSYAQVLHLLEGCAPTGAAFMDPRIWLTARCGAHRASVTASGVDVLELPRDLSQADVICDENGHMGLKLSDRGEVIPAADLVGAKGLAALLPTSIASSGARAVVYGKSRPTLAIASPTHDTVDVRRYRCAGALLLPDG